MITQLASSAGVGYNVARDAYVKSILDPLLQEKVRKSMNWLIGANFLPDFNHDDAPNPDLDDVVEAFDPSSVSADGIQIPKRMFNIDTGNMEDWPSGQYVILSHSWKGQEISFPFICKVKEGQKKREIYEMIQEDSDEESKRFARLQAKNFKHLEAGKSDVELLSAQCTYDINAQDKKINKILSRSGITSTTRDLLAQLAEFKEATWDERSARTSRDSQRKELDQRKMADEVLEKVKNDAGVDHSKLTDDTEDSGGSTRVKEEFLEAKAQLQQAEERLRKAEERLKEAKASCGVMHQNHDLLLALEELLPILERNKSMNKIKGSIREAKRILDSGLFPSPSKRRYLWNDTCCINKGDANELSDSLARMGEWYNNADFCLVHLDTPSATEWLSTWDHLEKPDELSNFHKFDEVSGPKWATRGWTLQELVLSKMTFYVNSTWKPLSRSAEGLGSYYYHYPYLDQHIRDKDIFNVPPEARSILGDSVRLKELMDSEEKIEYISYPGCSDMSRRLIGLLDFLGVHFPGNMDDDNSSAYIRNTISLAAQEIEFRLGGDTPAAQRLKSLFLALGFDVLSIKPQARNLIKLLVRALIDDCKWIIEKDRKQVSRFSNHVPPSECCRGLGRSGISAQNILALASYRECTVAIDRVYSLMGVLGVKFPAFHAEGPTKAICRLLDEVVITTNDVSIFNWAGKDMGSPIRGRSLYPSNLAAFNPERAESYFTARRNDILAKASKSKRHGLQHTASRLTLLLQRTIGLVKRTAYTDVPIDLIKSILEFIRKTTLENLQPQLGNIGKLLVVYLENHAAFEEKYKPKPILRTNTESTQKVVNESNQVQSVNVASRFGIKAPKMPEVSTLKLKVKGFQGLYGKKEASEEPELQKETSNAAQIPNPPDNVTQLKLEPKTLVAALTDWVSSEGDIANVPDEFKGVFDNLETPNLDVKQQVQETTSAESVNKSMICPNPIMVTTSGIEGVFDIQRVIITMQNAQGLRYQTQNAASDSQKISGMCTISTALSKITVDFTCAAGVLKKQLDVCDVVHRALSDSDAQKKGSPTHTISSTQDNGSYYSKFASLSPTFMRQGSQTSGVTENLDHEKEDTENEETENESSHLIEKKLRFVQETNLNLIVGEWVLARFTGVEGANWFLCQFELGSTHSYYGRRIATDTIDFKNVLPETGLMGHWASYMHNKKTELCKVVGLLIQGRSARKYTEEVAGLDEKNDQDVGQVETELDQDSDNGEMDTTEKLTKFLIKTSQRGMLSSGGIMQSLADKWGERLQGQLDDIVIQQVPKPLRAAILNLNENEGLLPAMFTSGVQVHMF
ncbi:vegetative incompatibility HET-E-1 protein [Rutstroemia sp. NJR-2017a BVV2]|nr:vegetative incompatibility HET-E-1 protein [Rutstroemia sp. NJR-2017a BVV2]